MNDPAAPSSPSTFLTAEWRHLSMVNYLADPTILQPLVPRGTELDTFAGNTFISLVGFLFLDTRVCGVPVPFHRNFEEVNLRFYVKRHSGGDLQRGVVFVKEIVPKPVIAFIARAVYNENYIAMPMRHCVHHGESAEYGWRLNGHWNKLQVIVDGTPEMPVDESLEQFITEHYWGYCRQRDGSTMAYRVEHPIWRVWKAKETTVECDAASLYGTTLAAALTTPPHSTLLAEGSAVTVRHGVRI